MSALSNVYSPTAEARRESMLKRPCFNMFQRNAAQALRFLEVARPGLASAGRGPDFWRRGCGGSGRAMVSALAGLQWLHADLHNDTLAFALDFTKPVVSVTVQTIPLSHRA